MDADRDGRRRRRPAGRIAGALVATVLAVLVVVSALPTQAAFTASITNQRNSAATARYFSCYAAVTLRRDDLALFYELTDYGNRTAPDQSSQGWPGTYQGAASWARDLPMACPRDRGGAYVLDGTSSYLSTSPIAPAPTTFSVELWFTTTTPRGKLVGFESTTTGPGNAYDRHVYVGSSGRLVFGAYSAAANPQRQAISSTAVVTDGRWHHVVATLSPTAGAALYLDGQLTASSATMTTADVYDGSWRFGQGTLDFWPDQDGGPTFFKGSLRYASVYKRVLTPDEVRQLWAAGQSS